MEVRTFTCRKNAFGTYYKQGFLNVQKMDDHMAKMLNDGWEVLTQKAQRRAESSQTIREKRLHHGSFGRK